MKDFLSVGKVVEGNEGDKCNYPMRLDTYGCGCQHDCSYCYAKSLLDFRKLWNPEKPSVAPITKISREIRKIPKYVDFDKLNNLGIKKILVEFLRVNSWIEKWFDIDYSEYTVNQSGYKHMPLEKKLKYIEKITGFEQMTVCEDESKAYEYWRDHFNYNKDDCCNLRRNNG